MRPRRCRLEFLLLFASTLLPAYAFSQTTFYEGKTITLISGSGAGGTREMRVKDANETFGNGDVRGVIAPECANNAKAGGISSLRCRLCLVRG